MRYSILSCPKCRATLEPLGISYISLGNPFVKCYNCGIIVKLSHINEWEQIHFLSKIWYYFVSSIWPIFWGAGTGGIIAAILDEVFEIKISTSLYLSMICIGAIIWLSISLIKFQKEVVKSKQRTQDPEYRAKLGIKS